MEFIFIHIFKCVLALLSGEENQRVKSVISCCFLKIQTSNKSISTRFINRKHFCYFLARKWWTWEAVQMYFWRWFIWPKTSCKQTEEWDFIPSFILVNSNQNECAETMVTNFLHSTVEEKWKWGKDSILDADESDEFLFSLSPVATDDTTDTPDTTDDSREREGKQSQQEFLSIYFYFLSLFSVVLENPVRDRDGSNSSPFHYIFAPCCQSRVESTAATRTDMQHSGSIISCAVRKPNQFSKSFGDPVARCPSFPFLF